MAAQKIVDGVIARVRRAPTAQQRLALATALDRAVGGPNGLAQRLREERVSALNDRHAEGARWTEIAGEQGVTVTRLQQLRNSVKKIKE